MLVPQRPINKIVNGTNKNLNLKEEMFSDKNRTLQTRCHVHVYEYLTDKFNNEKQKLEKHFDLVFISIESVIVAF